MAFAFFRRRQKLVIIIMAVLMVVFLVSFQGLRSLTERPRGERAMGTSRWGDVLYRDVSAASSDLSMLMRMGLGRSPQFLGRVPTQLEFEALMRNGWDQAALAYALLLREADRADVVDVTDQDVEEFLQAIRLTGAQYERLLEDLKEEHKDRTGLSTFPDFEQVIRATARRWLTVVGHFGMAAPSPLPSQPQLRHAFRDLHERINLRVGVFRARDLLEEVDYEPTGEEMLAQYNRYRTESAGRPETPEDYGFGYRRPPRVRISYLFIDRGAVERAARPSQEKVDDYYRDNPDEIVDKPAPSVRPATGPATASSPTTDTVECRLGDLEPAEAEPIIVEKLMPNAVNDAINDLLGEGRTLLDAIAADAETDPYLQVGRKMRRPAGDALSKRITVWIEGKPLRRAVQEIAEDAEIQAICYPWGTHGDVTIAPDVEITLPTERTYEATVGSLLNAITEKLLGPAGTETQPAAWKLDWAHCRTMGNALFPVGGELEMFPVSAGRTELLTFGDLLDHPILGNAYTAEQGGEGLWRRAFGAEAFAPPGQGTMDEGGTGTVMFVRGERPGRLLWRLTETVPAVEAREAETVEEIPADLREEVRTDLKLKAAMRLAREKAEQAVAAAEGGDLPQALEEAGAEMIETGLFSRRMYDLQWRGIPQMRLGGVAVQKHLAEQAFALAPEEVTGAKDNSVSRPKVLDLPPHNAVAVLQRIGYEPATESEFEVSRGRITLQLARRRYATAATEWFSSDNVVLRAGYKASEQP
jgi:hypothetical protein